MAGARVGRLATVTASGQPHVVPCCFVLDGDTLYSAVDAKPKSTRDLRRLANIRATGRASLLVDHYSEDWSALWWVRVDGTARVLDPGRDARGDPPRGDDRGERGEPEERDRALALLAAKHPQYRGSPPQGAVVAIDITTWRTWP